MKQRNTYTEKKAFHERLAYRYFLRLRNKITPVYDYDAYHILTPNELEAIRLLERSAYGIAMLYGTLGVVLLYIPYWIFPSLFPEISVDIPFTNMSTAISPIFLIYGFILVFIELVGLTLLNLWVVHKIADICKFPPPTDPHFDTHTEALFIVGMEKESKRVLTFGINPLAGVSKLTMLLYTALFLFKATLSNLLMKFVLRRVAGRLAIRNYVDLIGIPIFAFWNAYATYLVIQRAKIRIMAPFLVNKLTGHLQSELGLCNNEEFKSLIYDTLQFIAEYKRNFHYNHYLLTSSLILGFDLEIKDRHIIKRADFLGNTEKLKGIVKEGIFKMLVFGILIDGVISPRERSFIKNYYKKGIIRISHTKVQEWSRSFIKGEGLDDFFQTTLTYYVEEEKSVI